MQVLVGVALLTYSSRGASALPEVVFPVAKVLTQVKNKVLEIEKLNII